MMVEIFVLSCFALAESIRISDSSCEVDVIVLGVCIQIFILRLLGWGYHRRETDYQMIAQDFLMNDAVALLHTLIK